MTRPAGALAINARFTLQPQGGQQRVGSEILKRLGLPFEAIAPKTRLEGLKGHLWEQLALPARARGALLWSPSATGPILYSRQVVTLHDVAFIDAPEFFHPRFVRFYNLIMPALLSRAAHIVTVSEFSRRRIIEHYGLDPAKVSMIPNGVSSVFRPHEPAEIETMRRALNLPQHYVLVQATSDRRKNLKRILEAWAEVQHRLPDHTLAVSGRLAGSHVFGDADALPDVPRTTLLGFVADEHFGPLISGAAAFLFPSLYEGFGLPIIEAFACGTPVITGNVTAMPEIAGDAALLVDPTSASSIGEAILSLANDPVLRGSLRQRGFDRAAQFSWDSAAAQYRSLFQRLLG